MTREGHRPDDDALVRALFAPDAVALIGASTNPGKNTGRPLRFLRKHGYSGRIVPINPAAPSIEGIECHSSLAEAPGPIDHAFIMLAADAVEAAVRECAAAGIRCVTILSDGFSEAGATGQAREQRLLAMARETGIRVLGPNSIGVIDTRGFACSANATLEMDVLPRGGYGVISQSGSMIGGLLSRGAAQGIGFSSLVSVGNESDLTVGEVGALMLRDPRCTAILLFLEAIKDRVALADLARLAEAAGIPVLAYKLGRSKEGQQLAATHTGALAGDDAAADALLAHLGIARVKILETLFEAPPLFMASAPATGRRVAVVTTTGGGGAMVVDALATNGLDIAPMPPGIRTVLSEHGVAAGSAGLIDLTLAGTRPELVRQVLDILMVNDAVDAVAMVIGSSSQFYPELAVAPLRGHAKSSKPLAVYLVPAAEDSRRMLTAEGLAIFRTAESCAEGLRARLLRRPPPPEAAPDSDLSMRIGAALARAGPGALDEIGARGVMDALGIAGPSGQLVTSAPAAAEAFSRIGGPVVMKIVSPDIPHKSDTGGIVLGLDSRDDAEAAFVALMDGQARAHPAADLRGVLVQGMARGLGEALIGYRLDASCGPMILLGAGGVLAEILGDTAMRVAQVDLSTAWEMIDEVKFLKAMRGYRSRPVGDLEALAAALVALSGLAHCPQVHEAEINPLLIGREGEGILALDALVVRADAASGGEAG